MYELWLLYGRDFPLAEEWGKKAIELSTDPLFTVWPKMVLATYAVQSEQFQEADKILQEIIPFCRHLGMEYVLTHAQALQGVVWIATGHFSRGLKKLKSGLAELTQSGRLFTRYLLEVSLAEVYFQIATRTRRLGLWTAVKNLGFIFKEVPFAKRKAVGYLKKVIQIGKEVGAKGYVQGHAWLDLGLLYQSNGRGELAKECFGEANLIFGQCNSETGYQQVQQVLASAINDPVATKVLQ